MPTSAPDDSNHPWKFSLWACCDPAKTCCCACLFPCCLFGKTASRWKEEQNENQCNTDCCLFSILGTCGLHWLPVMMQRSKIRKYFHIKGSTCGDCVASACCTCCVLVQNDKQSQQQRSTSGEYRSPTKMEYPRN